MWETCFVTLDFSEVSASGWWEHSQQPCWDSEDTGSPFPSTRLASLAITKKTVHQAPGLCRCMSHAFEHCCFMATANLLWKGRQYPLFAVEGQTVPTVRSRLSQPGSHLPSFLPVCFKGPGSLDHASQLRRFCDHI